MKVIDLEGAALDWAVWACEKPDDEFLQQRRKCRPYSNDWAQGGPIIERERIATWGDGNLYWEAECGWAWGKGPTPLIAAMRCYVTSKVGEEIEVPDELMEGE